MALVVPKFDNESQEADWWHENRELVEQEFLLAAKEGRLKRGTLLKRVKDAEAKRATGSLRQVQTANSQSASK